MSAGPFTHFSFATNRVEFSHEGVPVILCLLPQVFKDSGEPFGGFLALLVRDLLMCLVEICQFSDAFHCLTNFRVALVLNWDENAPLAIIL